MIVTLYYSLTFIFALFIIGRLVSNKSLLVGVGDKTKRSFLSICIAFVSMSIFYVVIGVSPNRIIDGISLYICEFLKFGILVNGAELCAIVTDKKAEEKRTIFKVNSELSYVCIAILAVRTILEHASIRNGVFGDQFIVNNYLGHILYIVLYVLILFMYAAYTYLFYYSINKKREIYIFRMCILVVAILGSCLLIESLCYIRFGEFVPIMNLGILSCIYIFKLIIEYRRSIEYNENDYLSILAPSYKIPSFVCDDSGLIIFENIRAFVMKQTYKDNYVGNYITDVFEISDYDRDRLEDPRIKQGFDIYCKYPKEKSEILLKAKHNIDRYGEIFSTEIEFHILGNDNGELDIENDSSDELNSNMAISIDSEELYQVRLEELLSLIANQEQLYKEDKKWLFVMNLKGIMKIASAMNMTSLENLCARMEETVTYNDEWENMGDLLIELDRQYETLKLIK